MNSNNKFFYKANIQPPTAVTECLKANFILHPKSDEKLHEELRQQKHKSLRDSAPHLFEVQTNIILSKFNLLIVCRINESKLQQILEIPFSEQIIHMIKIPVKSIAQNRGFNRGPAQPQSHHEKTRDILFVLTSEFNCCLLGHNDKGDVKVISYGSIIDTIGQKRDPPYSVFLSANNNYIALQLYENVVKIIPILENPPTMFSQNQCNLTLGQCFNVRIRHANTMQILPLYEYNQNQGMNHNAPEQSYFSVVFKEQNQNMNQPYRMLNKMRKYAINIQDKDIIDPPNKDDNIELESQSTYLVYPLVFGGYLVFTEQQIQIHIKRKQKIGVILLKKPMRVNYNFISSIDAYNSQTESAEDGQKIFRYVFGTQEGELYILAFNLDSILSTSNSAMSAQNKVVTLEFLGAGLSECSCLEYIQEGIVYYGSRKGDSYLIQICSAKNDANTQQPYITILETYQNFGLISDMQILRHTNQKSSQYQLLVACGNQVTGQIAVLRRGIGINDILSGGQLNQLPKISFNGLFCVYNKVCLVFQGIPQIVFFELSNISNKYSIQDIQTSNQFNLQDNEHVIAVNEVKFAQQKAITVVTNMKVTIYSENLQQELCKYESSQQGVFITHYSQQDSKFILSLSSTELLYFNLDQSDFKQQQQQSGITVRALLKPLNKCSFDYDISAIEYSEKYEYAYISLWDAPLFSIVVIHVTSMKVISKRSVAGFFQGDLYKHFMLAEDLRQDLKIDVGQIQPKQIFQRLNSNFQVSALTSIKVISLENQDCLICSLPKGPILQFFVDISIADQIRTSPQKFPPQLYLNIVDLVQNYRGVSNSSFSSDTIQEVIWNIKIISVSNQEVLLQKLQRDSKSSSAKIVACCSKPVIFYAEGDIMQMQYISNLGIQQIGSIICNDKSVIAYENKHGQLVIGIQDSLSKIQTLRYEYKNKISKIQLLSDESLLVLSEQPQQYEYQIGQHYVELLSVPNFDTNYSFELEQSEMGNCIYQIKPEKGGTGANYQNQQSKSRHLVFIGTLIADLNENMVSKGFIRVFEVEKNQTKLELIYKQQVNGSVQKICSIKDRYLVVAINSEIHVYSVFFKNNTEIRLDYLKHIQYGKLIMDMSVELNQIIVGDLIKGIKIIDFKEGRMGQNTKMLNEGPQCSHAIMSHYVIPLSTTQFMLFDQEANVYMYERVTLNQNEQEKYKLKLVGCTRLSETVTNAIVGGQDYNNQEESKKRPENNNHEQRGVKEMKQRTKKGNKSTQQNNEDQEMKIEELVPVSDADYTVEEIKNDKQKLLEICSKAYIDMNKVKSSQQRQIIYGTQDGGISTLLEIPSTVYKFMKVFLDQLDGAGISEFGKIPSGMVREVKTDSIKHESFSFIDGNFLENFIAFDPKIQHQLVNHIFGFGDSESSKKVIKQIREMIIQMIQKH